MDRVKITTAAAEFRSRVRRGEEPKAAMSEVCDDLKWEEIEALGDLIQLWPWKRPVAGVVS